MIIQEVEFLISELTGYHGFTDTQKILLRTGKSLGRGSPTRIKLAKASKRIGNLEGRKINISIINKTITARDTVDPIASFVTGVPTKIIDKSIQVAQNPNIFADKVKGLVVDAAKEVGSKKAWKTASKYVAKRGVKNIARSVWDSII